MSRLLERMRHIRRLARAQRMSGSLEWARLLEQYQIDPLTAPCEPRDGGLYFPCLGVVIPGPGEHVLLSGFHRAANLHEQGVMFDTSRPVLRASIGPVSVQIDTAEELLILEEIYLAGTYNFDLGGSLLIIDIGMNTAYTTIYFAAFHPDATIYSYEPFAPTFRCAEQNIAQNPTLASRIHAFQFGLSDARRTMDIEYIANFRGSVGVYGVPSRLKESGDARIERCEFHDAASELGRLWREYPDRRVVLKIDCEGSEYAIINRLIEGGQLARVDLLMIECHRRSAEHDPSALRASLSVHGFGCVHLQPNSPDISMLYALRATR